MPSYHIPPGVQPQTLASRPLLTTPQGGSIAIDARLLALWQRADGRTLLDLLNEDWSAPPVSLPAAAPQRGLALRAALACLCEAGLLERVAEPASETQPAQQAKPASALSLSPTLPLSPDALRPHSLPISVIIVNYNSLDWLDECLASLQSQAAPGPGANALHPIEIILVDNASAEDPLPWLAEHYPSVRTLRLERDRSLVAGHGLAYAINRGIELAQGDHYLILNPDTRLAPHALPPLLASSKRNASTPDSYGRPFPAPPSTQPASFSSPLAPGQPRAGSPLHTLAFSAPKLLYTWAPGFLNGLGNRVGPTSWGADNAQGHLDLGQFDDWQQLPSACFAAVLIPRPTWQQVGPLDEDFFIYYEDVEWSYRARLLGCQALVAPRAIVYHAFGRRTHTGQDVDLTPFKLSNVVHGRLRFAYKLLSPLNAARFLFNYALEDAALFLLQALRGRRPLARAILDGWRTFFRKLPALRSQRQELQARRRISDRELFAPQRQVPAPFIWRGLPELTWDIVQNTYLPLMLSGKTRPMPELESSSASRPSLLVISQDIVGEKMAGPGMRYLEMARALSPELDITLAYPGSGDSKATTPTPAPAAGEGSGNSPHPAFSAPLDDPGIHLVPYRFDQPGELEVLVSEADVVLFSSFILDKFPFLQKAQARRVVDLYDPLVLENLHYYQDQPLDVQEALNQQAVASMNRLLQAGDFFICGNQRQRDLWIGALAANGRINPHSFAQDTSLRSLIDVVGVGFPSRAPQGRPFLKGQHPAFPAETRIVLWGGGIWDWLDPLSLIQAWPAVVKTHPEARLVLLGTRHPNPLVPPHKMAERAIALAAELGEKDRTIFFYEWLSYEDREALLCEADIGVTLHPLHVETRYSIRTRILDYFWTGLPVLVSDGDVTSEWVRQYNLGRVVPPLDVEAVAQALDELLSQSKSSWAPAFARLGEVFAWPEVVAPLRRYCLSTPPPSLSRRGGSPPASLVGEGPGARAWKLPLARARAIWRTEGPRMLLHRLWRYVQWRLSRL